MKSDVLKRAVEEFLSDKGVEIITFKCMDDDVYEVEIDSLAGVTIGECADVNRHINTLFPDDDYELTVATYSISQPFMVPLHYKKNIDREVEVLLSSGDKNKGVLVAYEDDKFAIEYTEKVIVEGKKRKEEQVVTKWIDICDAKKVKLIF